MRGTYVIMARLANPAEIEVSNKRKFALASGYYGYVGSALGSLEARIARHLSARKKYHWHIDYLLHDAEVCLAICAETEHREECFIAQALSRRLPSVPGFGCTDCRCSSHLFFSGDFTHLNRCVNDAFKERNLSPLRLIPATGSSEQVSAI